MSFLDGEMAMLAQNYMKSKGVKLHLDTKVEAILGETVATAVGGCYMLVMMMVMFVMVVVGCM